MLEIEERILKCYSVIFHLAGIRINVLQVLFT